jgi:hypothetical protein
MTSKMQRLNFFPILLLESKVIPLDVKEKQK